MYRDIERERCIHSIHIHVDIHIYIYIERERDVCIHTCMCVLDKSAVASIGMVPYVITHLSSAMLWCITSMSMFMAMLRPCHAIPVCM